MTYRYIGSKARVAEAIAQKIGAPIGKGRFVDLFCGTGAVAVAAAKMGWDIHLNDHLYSAVIMASARITTCNQAAFSRLGGYESAVASLNAVAPFHGFVYKEYSPASVDTVGFERRYFSTENAATIDAMRRQIAFWTEEGRLRSAEKRLLLADLLSAANRVANIAGTYGCFLSKWQRQSLNGINLCIRRLPNWSGSVTVSMEDALNAPVLADDVVYLDPPYTKRQYAAYYHLLETIALGDEPIVKGVAGIRPWRKKASDFCYRKRALGAFLNLAASLPARRIFVSYSDDAHVEIDTLISAMKSFGRVTPSQLLTISRYRPNRKAIDGATSVTEYLIEIERDIVCAVA